MKKSLEINALFDTSEFDRSVDRMAQKLKDLYGPSNPVGAQAATAGRMNQMGLGVSGPSQGVQERATIQYRRELDGYIKQEYGKQESLTREYVKQKGLLKDRQEIYDKQLKGSETELKMAKELVKEKEKLARIENTRRQAELNAHQALDAKQRYQESMGGIGYKKGPMTRDEIDALNEESDRLSPTIGKSVANKAKGLSVIAASLAGVVKGIEVLAGAPQRVESARGAAIEGSTGRDLGNVYAGRAPFEAAWMQEREKSAGLSEQKKFWNRITDRAMGMLGATLVGAGAAMAIGSGGALGVPGAATAAAGSAMLMKDRYRKGIFGGSEYEQLLASEETKDFWSNLDAMKKSDPRKQKALEHFEQNFMQDLHTQRTLGLNNAGFSGEGGMLQRGASAGFSRDMITEMGRSIVGAGGSARMGQQAEFGLQMQRGGLTNASGILGALSGGVQAPEASKNAVIRIMSEAFRIGLNTSDYVEETRRFTQIAAEAIGRTGAATPEGQGRLTGTMGMFVGERTNQGIESARGAYEAFQQRGSQLGGRRGVMRYSEAMKDGLLSKLDPTDLTELLAMRPEDLQSSPAALAYFTKQTGAESSSQLLDAVAGVQRRTRFQIPSVRNKVQRYAEIVARYMKDQGLSQTELFQRARQGEGGGGIFGGKGGLPKNILEAVGGLGVSRNIEESGGYQDKAAFSEAGELIKYANESGKIGLPESAFNQQRPQDVLSGPTGRVEDDFVGAIASSADTVRKTFNDLIPVLQRAANGAGSLADSASSSASKQQSSNAARAAGMRSGDPNLGGARAATQDQASSRVRGGK